MVSKKIEYFFFFSKVKFKWNLIYLKRAFNQQNRSGDEVEEKKKAHTNTNNSDQKLSESTKRSVQIIKVSERVRKVLYRSCVNNALFYFILLKWRKNVLYVKVLLLYSFDKQSRPKTANSIAFRFECVPKIGYYSMLLYILMSQIARLITVIKRARKIRSVTKSLHFEYANFIYENLDRFFFSLANSMVISNFFIHLLSNSFSFAFRSQNYSFCVFT